MNIWIYSLKRDLIRVCKIYSSLALISYSNTPSSPDQALTKGNGCNEFPYSPGPSNPMGRYSVFIQWTRFLTGDGMENLSRLCHPSLAHATAATYDRSDSSCGAIGRSHSHIRRSLWGYLEDTKPLVACHERNDFRPA